MAQKAGADGFHEGRDCKSSSWGKGAKGGDHQKWKE